MTKKVIVTKSKVVNDKFTWWYVYRGMNQTKKEIYHGVSIDPNERQGGFHCVGATKALAHWDCQNDKISWETLSKHKTQSKASQISHSFEKNYVKRGYENIRTKGI